MIRAIDKEKLEKFISEEFPDDKIIIPQPQTAFIEHYKKIGYSDKAAYVFATLPYGVHKSIIKYFKIEPNNDFVVAILLRDHITTLYKQQNKESFIEFAYNFLHNKKEMINFLKSYIFNDVARVANRPEISAYIINNEFAKELAQMFTYEITNPEEIAKAEQAIEEHSKQITQQNSQQTASTTNAQTAPPTPPASTASPAQPMTATPQSTLSTNNASTASNTDATTASSTSTPSQNSTNNQAKPAKSSKSTDTKGILRGLFGGFTGPAKKSEVIKKSAMPRRTRHSSMNYCYSIPSSSSSRQLMTCDELRRTDSYAPIKPNNFKKVVDEPTSTIQATYNTASALRALMQNNIYGSTKRSSIRMEELLNTATYDLRKPTANKMFDLTIEMKDNQSENEQKHLFIGIKGKEILPAKQNFTILLDVSGSMLNYWFASQMSILTLLKKVSHGCNINFVTYSEKDEIILDGYEVNNEDDIGEIFYRMCGIIISGCTNGSAGINKAYELSEKHFVQNGCNRVVLITDGDLNFGIHDKDGLEHLVKEKKAGGSFLSIIGTGGAGYKDDILETLSKNGNGNYFYTLTAEDVYHVIYKRFDSAFYAIAKNVKIQVEFNPKFIEQYRMVGYENRTLSYSDFRDDSVESETFGSGSHAVVMYDVIPYKGNALQRALKYQSNIIKDSDEVFTATIRYQELNTDEWKEESFSYTKEMLSSTENIEKALQIVEFGRKVGNSYYMNDEKIKKLFLE